MTGLTNLAKRGVSMPTFGLQTGIQKSGTRSLACKAAPDDMLVELPSSNPLVANPVPPSVPVPTGVQVASFTVTTAPIAEVTKPKVIATANGIAKSRALTVNPPTP